MGQVLNCVSPLPRGNALVLVLDQWMNTCSSSRPWGTHDYWFSQSRLCFDTYRHMFKCCFPLLRLLVWLYVSSVHPSSPQNYILSRVADRRPNVSLVQTPISQWQLRSPEQYSISSLSSLVRNRFGNISQHLATLKNKPRERISCGVVGMLQSGIEPA